mmetsp:Transcript_27485/g.59786  ORF Transcript_27485/g.59786 Transcript_27485/m.59786 type:complete len:179 (+) Transcript_27485:829-1365(+)
MWSTGSRWPAETGISTLSKMDRCSAMSSNWRLSLWDSSDLTKMSTSAAWITYVNLLGTGHGPMSSSGGAQVRINAQVLGMGPQFKILVRIQNAGSTSLNDVPVHCTTNPNLYRIPKPCFFLPILVPQQVYLLEVPVACINENGGTASVRIFLASQHSHVPLISAVVQMPISEPPLLDF